MKHFTIRHKFYLIMFSETLFIKLSVGLPSCDGADGFFSTSEPVLLLSFGEWVSEIFSRETPVGLTEVVAAVVTKDVTTVCGLLHVTYENLDQDQLAENRIAVSVGLP